MSHARRERIRELVDAGSLLKARGELKAHIRTLTAPNEREERAEVLGDLGEVYMHMEKHNEAIAAYEEAIDILDDMHGRADPRRWVAAEKLADSHAQLANHAVAVGLYKDVVQNMLESPFGNSHPGMRVTLGKLGSSALAARDAHNAVSSYETLIQLAEGDDSEAAASARADANLQLSRALSMPSKKGASRGSKAEKARLLRALKHARTAKKLFEQLPEGESMDVAYSTNGIAGVLERLDRNDEAISTMEEALQLTISAKGSETDPDVVRAKKILEGLRSHIKRKLSRAAHVSLANEDASTKSEL
ncbi:MAG: hypothetical protein SGPRY_000566 [Prymnesium sp.]